MKAFFDSLNDAVIALNAKTISRDNAQKNLDGAQADFEKAVESAKDAYAKVSDAVKGLVPGIVPNASHSL